MVKISGVKLDVKFREGLERCNMEGLLLEITKALKPFGTVLISDLVLCCEEKHCDWCGKIIGSKEFKTFTSKQDPTNEIYFHMYCYGEMKAKALIG